MNISVRVNGSLAQLLGTSRLTMQVVEGETLGSLVAELEERFPHSKEMLGRAVPMAGGRHTDHSYVFTQEEEIALLMPVAGG